MKRFSNIHYILYSLFLISVLILQGCGTENPFDRGPDLAVDESALPPPGEAVSFSTDVIAVLSVCESCHASGAGGWTYDGGAGAHAAVIDAIDRGDPERSELLVKATGGGGHGGGRLFSTSSPQYQAIVDWIQQGALNN